MTDYYMDKTIRQINFSKHLHKRKLQTTFVLVPNPLTFPYLQDDPATQFPKTPGSFNKVILKYFFQYLCKSGVHSCT